MTFEVYGIVKTRKGKILAVGEDGEFNTDNPSVIEQLQFMGFKPKENPAEKNINDSSALPNSIDKNIKKNKSSRSK